jgi:hypothetical protein
MKQVRYFWLNALLGCFAYSGIMNADMHHNNAVHEQPMVEIDRDDLVRIATVLSLCARAYSTCTYVLNCSDPSDPLFDQINAVVNSIVAILNANSEVVIAQVEQFDTLLSQYDQLVDNKISVIEDELLDNSDNIGGVVQALSISDEIICSKLMVIERSLSKTLDIIALAFAAPLVVVDEIVNELEGEELSAALENLSVVLEIIADVGKGIA